MRSQKEIVRLLDQLRVTDPLGSGKTVWGIVWRLFELRKRIPAAHQGELKSFLFRALENEDYVTAQVASDLLFELQPTFEEFKQVLRFITRAMNLGEDPSEQDHPYRRDGIGTPYGVEEPVEAFHAPSWSTVNFLAGALQDSDAEVREGALYALGEYECHQSAEAHTLMGMVERLSVEDESSKVRDVARETLEWAFYVGDRLKAGYPYERYLSDMGLDKKTDLSKS